MASGNRFQRVVYLAIILCKNFGQVAATLLRRHLDALLDSIGLLKRLLNRRAIASGYANNAVSTTCLQHAVFVFHVVGIKMTLVFTSQPCDGNTFLRVKFLRWPG